MFQHGDFKIEGTSVSGVATSFVVHPYKVVVDIGVCTPEAVKCQWVFITHAHIDHMGAAAQHAATRDMMGMDPTKFVCSAGVADGIRRIMDVWQEIQGSFKYEIVVVNPGERVSIGKGVKVEAFGTHHRVPSQGYAFTRMTTKIKPEFAGKPAAWIGAQVRAGVQVKDEYESVEMVFTGDSTSEVHFNTMISRAKIIVAEATFVNDKVSVAEAREKGHTHMSEIVEHAACFAGCERVVFTHFSNRHDQSEIDAAVAAMPSEIREKAATIW